MVEQTQLYSLRRTYMCKQAKKSGNQANVCQVRICKSVRNKMILQLCKAIVAFFGSQNPRKPKRFWKAVKYLKPHKSSPFPMVTLLLNVMLTKQNFFIFTCFNSAQSAQTHANSNQTMPVLGTFFVKKKEYLHFACTRHLQS